MRLCECDCGQVVRKGRRFIRYHHLKIHNKDPKFRAYISKLQKKRLKEKTHQFYRNWLNPNYARLKLNLENKETLSYILGAALGDGSVLKYERNGKYYYPVRLRVADREFADEFYSALQKIGLHPSLRLNELHKKNPKWRDSWEVRAYSKTFYFWFKNVIPEDFLGDDLDYQIKFLKGFFESEGYFKSIVCFDKRRGKEYPNYAAEVYNTNLALILLAKKIVGRMGLHPNIRNRPTKTKMLYILSLSRKGEVKEFLEKLNPCIPRKRWHEAGCN